MANVARRKHCRRRLAAITFLSTISLDGTHRDTPLGVLNLNVQQPKVKCVAQDVRKSDEEDSLMRQCILHHPRRLTLAEGVALNNKRNERKKDIWSSCDEKIGSMCNEGKTRSYSKSKDRVQKFINETKARFTTLSQKRKFFIHQKSALDSLGVPSECSSESISGATQSRKSSITMLEMSICSDTKYPKVLNEHFENERFVLMSSKTPFVIYSSVPFYRQPCAVIRCEPKPDVIRRRHNSSLRQLPAINDELNPLDLLFMLGIKKPEEGQDISFGNFLSNPHVSKRCQSYGPDVEHPQPSFSHHLHPSGCISFDQAIARAYPTDHAPCAPSPSIIEKERQDPCHHHCHIPSTIYNPNLLDDPNLIAGKHSTLLSFPSYITSVINYVKPSDLRKDLNDRFREKFPHIGLSLSKLRSLKKEMLQISHHECNIDLAVVAQAFVYFEKLILKTLINKQNRKLCAGACLMLSAKLNDVKGLDFSNLLEKIETIFRVNRKELTTLEFQVLVALEFSLHLPHWEVLPHYQHLVYAS